jgi:hypothetical protein
MLNPPRYYNMCGISLCIGFTKKKELVNILDNEIVRNESLELF